MAKKFKATPRQARIIRDNPDKILDNIRKQGGRMILSDLFVGDEMSGIRAAIETAGVYKTGNRELRVKTRPIPGTDEHEVLAIAAVARDPGRSEDFLETIQDYQSSGKSQDQKVEMYWNIYRNEGIVNNATNKIAAILSTGGTYRVRKAKKGKKQGASEILQELLYQWTRRVNSSPEDAVVTAARGLKAVTHQGVRQALVEGSWVGRTVWTNAEIPGLGRFDLPMNIQGISTANLEPLKGLTGTPVEGFYWKPSRDLIRELTNPSDKDAAKLLKKFVPRDLVSKLKADGKVLLDPALLLHIKHRGVDTEAFGESFIHAALPAIAYRRAIDQLDLVSMQNIINRLTIVMVGSDDPTSPYSKSDVATARAALMQQFFEDPGPNMTIIWSGKDVTVEDVGAQTAVLSLDERHKISEGKVKVALGVPDALLSGSTSDGKAAGWAASIGTAAELEELQNAFAQIYTTLGERIAVENGFTEVDLVYEFDRSTLVDKMEERNQVRNDYMAGALSLKSYLLSLGKDPDAEFRQRAFERGLDPDDENTTWEMVFMPPQGLQGQGEGKVPGNGRTPDSQTGKTAPERKPKPTTQENK